MRKGIGGHTLPNNGATVHWLTPPEIVKALGPFDLDPCAARKQPWRTAKTQLTLNGLGAVWQGRVWLNPPYGDEAQLWIRKLACHGTGTAILFARTETDMFHTWVWNSASALFFFRGRLHFHYPSGERAKGNAGGPSVLVAYGRFDALKLKKYSEAIHGKYIYLGVR